MHSGAGLVTWSVSAHRVNRLFDLLVLTKIGPVLSGKEISECRVVNCSFTWTWAEAVTPPSSMIAVSQ